MELLHCAHCGKKEVKQEGDVFVCASCGYRYSLEQVRRITSAADAAVTSDETQPDSASEQTAANARPVPTVPYAGAAPQTEGTEKKKKNKKGVLAAVISLTVILVAAAVLFCVFALPAILGKNGDKNSGSASTVEETETDPEAVTTDAADEEPGPMSPKDIYALVSPCVAEIIVYDEYGDAFASGSGFFINDHGLMVTNYHVMKGAYSATATTLDGNERDVRYVIDYDSETDVALIQINSTKNDYLIPSRAPVVTGDKIYTIGSSLGLTGTLSDGIVSTASREVDGIEYIQITAPISPGNSGGPLVNEYGEVIGINTWQYVDGQNLNFSLPVYRVDDLDKGGYISMEAFGSNTSEPSSDQSYIDESLGFYSEVGEDYWEVEYNDSYLVADPMEDGMYFAGAVADDEDVDWFSITVDGPTSFSIEVVPFYVEEVDCIFSVLTEIGEDDYDVVGYFDSEEDEDGFVYRICEGSFDHAGTYHLAVTGDVDADSEYPFYYAVRVTLD